MRTALKARWARYRVFFTCVVALSILGVLVYLLTGGTLFTPKVKLRTYIDDTQGMPHSAAVLFNGVKIGKVTSIELSHLNDPLKVVVVEMVVERRSLSQIPEDSRTEVFSENILGDKYISIEPGKSSRPIQDNGVLAHKPAGNLLSNIDLTTFEAKLRTIDQVFKDIEAGKGSVGLLVKSDQLYRDTADKLKSLQQSIEGAADTSSTLGGMMYGQESYQRLSTPLRRLDSALAEIQAGRGSAGKFLNDPSMHDQWRRDMADLRRLAADISQSPLLTNDDLYVSLNRRLASFIRSVDDFNAGVGAGQYLVSAELYESLSGSVKQMQSTLKEFRSSPQKFLRINLGIF
jgi:phospholipid/cholesterol/gamma-HCH transport system substrate-binding protein